MALRKNFSKIFISRRGGGRLPLPPVQTVSTSLMSKLVNVVSIMIKILRNLITSEYVTLIDIKSPRLTLNDLKSIGFGNITSRSKIVSCLKNSRGCKFQPKTVLEKYNNKFGI